MSVDWAGLDQLTFDRVVEALVRDRFGAGVRAVNGKGGDEGIDIEIRLEYDIVWILQLKFYPGGFSSEHRKRRREIANSYHRAEQHRPAIWSLVVPELCTPGEQKWVTALNDGKSSPHITVIDRDDLDAWLGAAPHIDQWAQRNVNSELERLAKIFGQEKAAILGGVSDVLARVRDLGGVVNSLDLDWAVDFAHQGGRSSVIVRPRHPGAPVTNPVTFAVEVGELDAELERVVMSNLGYATSETVHLPAEVVRSVHISGGPFQAGEYPPGPVQFVTRPGGPGRGKQLEFKTFHEGSLVGTFEGIITHAAPGPIGGTIEADFSGGHLKARLRLPHHGNTTTLSDMPGPGFEMALDFDAQPPSVVADVLSTARMLRLASRVEIRVQGALLTAVKPTYTPDSDDAEMIAIEEFAGDLAVIQRHTNSHFTMPTEMRPGERVKARVARLLAENYIVASPRAPRLTLEMSGDDTPGLREMLSRPQQPILWPAGPFTETLAGRELLIGDVYVVGRRAAILNGAEAIAALDSGTAQGFKVILEPVDEPYFYLTLANVDQTQINSRYLAAWSLYGIDQPGLPPELTDPNA
ncbi:hypothetical protein [Mycolicibacterium wolinskyi]|uniref:hypothetical protein n=2 Tax=Mycobacteriaceae TaxID=1762 RepID=UPI0013FD13FE|nr:hypothetical protein [Mycolicibacterium wolinskyi]